MRLGITGNVGSGKSAVGTELEKLGAMRIDADKIVHELYAPNTTLTKKISTMFGNEVVAKDGSINRDILGQKVFNDSAALEKLNALVHPEAKRAVEERMRLALPDQVIAVEAALLIEGNWSSMFDKIVLVVASRKHREKRLLRRGMSPERIAQLIDIQISSHEKLPHVDIILDNNGTHAELIEQVKVLWQTLQNNE